MAPIYRTYVAYNGNTRMTVVTNDEAERLRWLLSASPTIIYTLRRGEGGLVPLSVSANVERITGYSPEEALSRRGGRVTCIRRTAAQQ